MGDPTGISGAAMGALLTKVINMAGMAKRCKENCNKVAKAVAFIEPIIKELDQSSKKRSIEVEKWLKDIERTLEIAKEEISHCIPTSRMKSLFQFRKRGKLSERLKEIEVNIKGLIDGASFFQFGIVEDIHQLVEDTHHRVEDMHQRVEDIHKGVEDTHHRVEDMHQRVEDIHQQLIDVNDGIEDVQFQPTPEVIVDFGGESLQNLLRHIQSAASDKLGKPMTIGLKGQGGIGKTLLAKLAYNDSSIEGKFESMMYITVGRDASISAIYKVIAENLKDGGVFEKSYASRSIEDQCAHLHGRFLKKRVLLVLDDVWDDGGIISSLDMAKGLGSVTLVTTRNKVVLSNMKAHVTVDVQTLSEKESEKLFNYHAFGSNTPSLEIKEIAQKICAECNGLPLALEVIGSAMWEKEDLRHWHFTLNQLKNSRKLCNSSSVEERLFKCLQYSYEEMEDASKKCFLYVAAFPEDFEIPISQLCAIWLADDIFDFVDMEEGMQLAWIHLTSLADRSLIDLHKNGKTIKVHDLLRDLAIRIIGDAKPTQWACGCYFQPGKLLKRLPQEGAFKRMSLVGSTISKLPINIQMPDLSICLLSRLQISNNMQSLQFPNGFFDSMKKLKFLDMSDIDMLGMARDDSTNVFNSLLSNVEALHSMRSLDLSWCGSLVELPESVMTLRSLTSLNLGWCRSLRDLPNSIKELKSLIILSLRCCKSLKELPESISELKSLTSLDLLYCESLTELPENIQELKSLTRLNLLGCKSLTKLPKSFKGLISLTKLKLGGSILLEGLPQSIKGLKSLTSLTWSTAADLYKRSNRLESLASFNLSCYLFFEEVLGSLKELQYLTSLDLSWNQSTRELPANIKELKSLRSLKLSRCISLENLPNSIEELKSLGSLDLSHCTSLRELPENITKLKSLTSLSLLGCESLEQLPKSIKELKSLTSLNLSWCKSLKKFPEGIEELKSLTYLSFLFCTSLEELPKGMKELKSLTYLGLAGCTSLKELPEGIKELKFLGELNLSYCELLKENSTSSGGDHLTSSDAENCIIL